MSRNCVRKSDRAEMHVMSATDGVIKGNHVHACYVVVFPQAQSFEGIIQGQRRVQNLGHKLSLNS